MQRYGWVGFVFLTSLFVITAGSLPAMALTKFFNQSQFAAAAGTPLKIFGFDDRPQAGSGLNGTEYVSQGLTIRSPLPINVVGKIGEPYGANYITSAQLNSAPNGISNAFYRFTASPSVPDDLEFVFSQPTRAAGLYFGGLGGGGTALLNPTQVRFFTPAGQLIAEETLRSDHAGVIRGIEVWDNRLFYGVVSTSFIGSIRVTNAPNDGDSVLVDDVQFVPAPLIFPVTIKRNGYPGPYYVYDVTGRAAQYTADETIQLAPGTLHDGNRRTRAGWSV